MEVEPRIAKQKKMPPLLQLEGGKKVSLLGFLFFVFFVFVFLFFCLFVLFVCLFLLTRRSRVRGGENAFWGIL